MVVLMMKTTVFCDDDDDDITSTQDEFGDESDTTKFILNSNYADFFADLDESNETLTDEMICL